MIWLIQPQDADCPGTCVEKLALVEQELAPDYLVARSGVSYKLDAPDVVLLLLVEPQGEVDDLPCLVDFRVGFRREVNEAVFAVDLAVGLQGLADFFGREDVSLLEREGALQRIDLEGKGLVWIGAYDLKGAHVVAVTLLDGYGDIDGPALAVTGERNPEEIGLEFDVFENGLADGNLEIAVVSIQAANANFEVLAQFFAIVGLCQNWEIPEVKRNRIGPVVAHDADQLAVAEGMISAEFDFADFDLRPLFDFEDQNDGVARLDPLVLRRNLGELTPVFPEQVGQDDLGFLDLCGVELALDGEANLALLEAVENVGL